MGNVWRWRFYEGRRRLDAHDGVRLQAHRSTSEMAGICTCFQDECMTTTGSRCFEFREGRGKWVWKVR